MSARGRYAPLCAFLTLIHGSCGKRATPREQALASTETSAPAPEPARLAPARAATGDLDYPQGVLGQRVDDGEWVEATEEPTNVAVPLVLGYDGRGMPIGEGWDDGQAEFFRVGPHHVWVMGYRSIEGRTERVVAIVDRRDPPGLTWLDPPYPAWELQRIPDEPLLLAHYASGGCPEWSPCREAALIEADGTAVPLPGGLLQPPIWGQPLVVDLRNGVCFFSVQRRECVQSAELPSDELGSVWAHAIRARDDGVRVDFRGSVAVGDGEPIYRAAITLTTDQAPRIEPWEPAGTW